MLAVVPSIPQHVFVFKPQSTCCLITSLRLTMSFFANALNISIFGGSFINNEGSLTINDRNQHSTNVNSKNKSTSNVIDSHNDNSTTISEQCDGFTFNGRLIICCKVAVMNRCMRNQNQIARGIETTEKKIIWTSQKWVDPSKKLLPIPKVRIIFTIIQTINILIIFHSK